MVEEAGRGRRTAGEDLDRRPRDRGARRRFAAVGRHGGRVAVIGGGNVATDAGIYQLLDADKKVLVIKGVDKLRTGLEAMLDKADIARFFVVEEAPFFSQRENQLIQGYMLQYGGMPPRGRCRRDGRFILI